MTRHGDKLARGCHKFRTLEFVNRAPLQRPPLSTATLHNVCALIVNFSSVLNLERLLAAPWGPINPPAPIHAPHSPCPREAMSSRQGAVTHGASPQRIRRLVHQHSVIFKFGIAPGAPPSRPTIPPSPSWLTARLGEDGATIELLSRRLACTDQRACSWRKASPASPPLHHEQSPSDGGARRIDSREYHDERRFWR